jgi:transcriptional repressor NrdR
MKCPFCGHLEDKVIDSRTSKEGDVIRRRRECLLEECKRRFTSYERVEDVMPMVTKKDGRREPFDRQKILHGLSTALEKRPIDMEAREALVAQVERSILEKSEGKEIPSTQIGEEVMIRLHDLDNVAFVRFASVYRDFKDATEFLDVLKALDDIKTRLKQ